MPFQFHIDLQANLIRETWNGAVDMEQLQESCRREWEHPDYRPGMPLISDFRDADINMSVDDVLKFASWFSGEDKPCRHAIVVSSETDLDLAGLYMLISESETQADTQTQVFFSYVVAENWVQGQDARPDT